MSQARPITYLEYRRRVFNAALLECFTRIHNAALGGGDGDDPAEDRRLSEMASRICENFFTDELKLKTSTIDQTKASLKESVRFIHDCVETAENIAEDKAADAAEEKLEVTDDQEVELSPENKEVIDQLFANKNPQLQIDAIRDATVKALVAEDKKAEEIRQAVDVAQAKVDAGDPQSTLEETMNRLEGRGPTSLMHAIINNITTQAINSVNESGSFTSIGAAISNNKDEIKNRACMVYSLYEMCSVFGMRRWDSDAVKRMAYSIYYEK